MWLIYAVCAALFWGLNYSLDEKILHNKISPFILLTFQTALALLVYSTIVLSSSLKTEIHSIIKSKSYSLLLFAAAICGIIANVLICFSIKDKNATVAGIIELAYPIFTIFFTYILFKQLHLNWGVIVGGLLIFTGILLISLVN